MEAGRLVVAGALAAGGALAWAQAPESEPPDLAEAERTLDEVAVAIDATLREADAALAEAAGDLGRIGLEGEDARERLTALCEELTYAVVCSATSAEGVLVTVTPEAFTGYEGRDVTSEEHVRSLDTQQPTMSDAFYAVEGFDTVDILRPVYDSDGRYLGSASLLIRPAALVFHAIEPVVGETGLEVFVMQKDGYQLYDPDAEEIGHNLLTDPMYQGYPALLEVARRISADPEGTGEYEFLGRGFGAETVKRVTWTTVGLHGNEWRVAVTTAGPPSVVYEVPALPVSADIGLSALISLADGHLGGLADDLARLRTGATGDDLRSGDWQRIEEPLRRVSEANVAGDYWFARADGRYWTLGGGAMEANLADRPWFRRVLAGETVLGELTAGGPTGANVGVVAIPVRGADGSVTGVIGASVYLDQLSERVKQELGAGENVLFYAFDDEERLALHSDTDKLFLRAGELGPQVEEAFAAIEEEREGIIEYTLEDRPRTVVFRRSEGTGWWYAFGIVGELPPEG